MKIEIGNHSHNNYKELWKKSISRIILHLRIIKMFKQTTVHDEKFFQDYIIERSTRLIRGKSINLDSTWAILPESRFREIWNLIIGILLIYTAIVTPFALAFLNLNVGDWLFDMEIVIDVFFMTDVAINFFTAYYNEDNELVTSNSKIAKKYLLHGFFLDVIASFPFTLTDLTSKGYSNLIRIVRLRALSKLLKLSRLFKALKVRSNSILKEIQVYLCISHSIVRLAKFLAVIIICIHLAACIWHWTAVLDDFGPNTWVFKSNLLDDPIYRRYIISLYWAMTTLSTIGYGDIHPYSDTEKLVALLWMFFALYFLSFSISSLSSMLSQIDSKKTVLRNKMTFIDEFSKEVKLSKRLKKELQKKLLENIDRFNYSYSDRIALVSQFPKELKLEIAYTMHKGYGSRFDIFTPEDDNLLLEILPLLQHLSVQGLQSIYSLGESSTKIYFLIKGRVNFLLENEKTTFQVYGDGGYFGDIEVMLSIPRNNTAISSTECTFLIMGVDVLQKINDFFPVFFKRLKDEARVRQKINQRAKAEMRMLIEMNLSGNINIKSLRRRIKRETLRIAKRECLFNFKNSENLALYNNLMQTHQMIGDCQNLLSDLNEMLDNYSMT